MRQVKIKKMHVENFKGLRLFDVDFAPCITRITGANGTGKTTLHDAYLWLITGTDSSGRSDFRVQPIGKDGETVDHLLTSVSCTMTIDGAEHELRRTLEQKWIRKRGSKEDTMCGNTSGYYIDNVPLKANEYNAGIADLLCGMDDFLIISSLRAFLGLDTKTKRAMLLKMAGAIPDILCKEEYPHLWKRCQNSTDVDRTREAVTFELRSKEEEKKKIPVRITENDRDLPDGVDFGAIRDEIARKKNEIDRIDSVLQKKSGIRSGAFATVSKLLDEIRDIDSQIGDLMSSIRKERGKKEDAVLAEKRDAEAKKSEIESRIRISERELAVLSTQERTLEANLQEVRELWRKKNSETFSDSVMTECPTCHRPFPEEDIESMRNELVMAFNKSKSEAMKAIVENGNHVSELLSSARAKARAKEAEISSLRSDLADADVSLSKISQRIMSIPTVEQVAESSIEYVHLLQRRAGLLEEAEAATPKEGQDERDLKNRKETLSKEVESLLLDLAKESDIERVNRRRQELEEEDRRLAEEIAELDGVIYDIQRYSKAKISIVNEMVSGKFRYVKWRMNNPNLTNDGEREVCECLVDGVPVTSNVNAAGRVNAGVDIINSFSEWLGLSVPLWIDGKESVTNIIDTKAQLITLEVSVGDRLSVM